MAFIPGGTGTASSFPDGFTGSPLANVETISATKVLTTSDRRTQILTPSGALRIAQLPATAIIGEGWSFVCAAGSAFSLQINASNGTTITTLAPGESTWVNAIIATPTDAANWAIQIPSTVLANGTVSTPSLRFTGGGSDTGIYSPSLDAIAFSNAGVQTLLMSAAGAVTIGTGTQDVLTGLLRLKQSVDTVAGGILLNSTVAGQNGGMYHNGSALVLREGGVDSLLVDAGAATILGPVSVINGANGRINIGAANNYLYGDSSNNVILGTAGTDKLLITSAGAVTLGPTSVSAGSIIHLTRGSQRLSTLQYSTTSGGTTTETTPTTLGHSLVSVNDSYTDLSTTPRNIGNGLGIFVLGIHTFYLINRDNDVGVFQVAVGIEDGVAYKYSVITGSTANCSVSGTSTLSITGLGDGRTYTIAFTIGTGTATLSSSSLATGTTVLQVFSQRRY